MTTGTRNQELEALAGRRAPFVRMWRLVVLLRTRPHQLAELARMLSVSERTIRRDLQALQRVPLPIESRHPSPFSPSVSCRLGVRAIDRQEWFIKAMPAWPDREVAPIGDVDAMGVR